MEGTHTYYISYYFEYDGLVLEPICEVMGSM